VGAVERLAAGLGDRLRHVLALGILDVCHDHLRALARQHPRRGRAQPQRRPGDDRHLAVHSHDVLLLPVDVDSRHA